MNALRAATLIVLLLFLFGIGFFSRDVLAGNRPDFTALGRAVSPAQESTITPVETFQSHFNNIYAKHGQNTDALKLRHAAMSGLVNSLGDPHTNYLEPKINERFSTETQGNYSGIGARLQPDPLGAKIATVFPGSPAEAAGIKVGDIITQVDDATVGGQEVEKIVDQILGESGTQVKLGFVREGATGLQTLRITRRKVAIPTVEAKWIDPEVGYLSVTGFSETTPIQFEEALTQQIQRGAQGLIIDLRSNPGGLLESAKDMLSLFVAKKPVVTIKAREGKEAVILSDADRVIVGSIPIAIIVNEESASASEIFAGVMRDYNLAKLIGDHTYGKASVQDLKPLPGGASAKVTIAKYFLPASGDISRKNDEDGAYLSGGLKPDFEVKIPTGFEGFQLATPGKDPQFDRALKYILETKMN
jgi:carboxyl-terminal processing protease